MTAASSNQRGPLLPHRPPVKVRGAGRYEVLLLLLTVVLVLAPFISTALQPVIVALLGGVLVYALWTSFAATSLLWVAAGLSLACVTASAIAPIWSDSSRSTYALVSILLSLAAIASITVHLTLRRTPTSATLAGAVTVFLLAGLVFADLYICMAELSGVPFFAQTSTPNSVSYLYYSYTILTTVGFGDLTAATDAGRMLAVVEALVGQLYLVTVVAVIVANHRLRPTSSSEEA